MGDPNGGVLSYVLRAMEEREARRQKAMRREAARREGREFTEDEKPMSKWELKDLEAKRFNDEYNKVHRPESLMAVHAKRVRLAGAAFTPARDPHLPPAVPDQEGRKEEEKEGKERRCFDETWRVRVQTLESRNGPHCTRPASVVVCCCCCC